MKSLSAATGDSILSRRRNPQPEEGKKGENNTLDFWIFVYSEVAAYHTFKQLRFRVQLPMAPCASNVLRTAPRSASVAQRQAVEPTKSVKPLTSCKVLSLSRGGVSVFASLENAGKERSVDRRKTEPVT